MPPTRPTTAGSAGSGPPLPADLLTAALRRDAAAPLITFYDDATDERVELSAATLANWVAKTANLLQDEFDVGPGSAVAVALPVHWQTAAVLLGVWSCGATVLDSAVEDDEGLDGVDVVLAAEERLAALEDPERAEIAEMMGLSLHPLGLGMAGYTGQARDFALEVRVHGDVFSPYRPTDPAASGLRAGGLELSLGGLVETARELGERLGIAAGDRVLIDEATAEETGAVAWLLAPLAAGASLVITRHPAEERMARRAADERVTATLGRRIDGVRELGRPA